jgi:glycosyltransferase involved in cell wall biosynthesis
VRGPAFSVVVPAYRSARTIGATIRSILAQDEPDFELIVVDDGSGDDTAAVIEAARERDSRIQLISQENGGTAAARNTGWRAARAPLVAFLDDDDLWMPDYLSSVGAALAAHPQAGFAQSDAFLYDEAIGKIRRLTSFEHYEPIPEFIPAADLIERLVRENFVLSAVTVRAEVLERLDGFDPDLRGTDDWDLWLRIAAAGFGSTHPPRPVIVQRDRPDSQSKDEALMFRGSVEVLEKLLASCSLSPEVASLARSQAAACRARASQIEENAPIERARRLRRRFLARRDVRGGTWLDEPPAAVAAALPEIAVAYGRPVSRTGGSRPA